MDRTDGIGNCSITVHLRQTKQVSGGGVLFEACRVGSVNRSDGNMTLNWNLGELTRLRESMSTEQITSQLSELLFRNRDGSANEPDSGNLAGEEIRSAVTSEKGTCTFSNLEEGAWLIHASDSSAYGRIEDALVAVPGYVQTGSEWKGPLYDQDVWPKADIREKQSEIPDTPRSPDRTVPETDRPETKAPETDKPDTKVPQTNKQETEGPQTETPDTEIHRIKAPKKKTKETEKTEIFVKDPKETESGKKPRTPHQGTTSQSTQVVRTLDDTPLSGLIFALLSCSLVIAAILIRWRRSGRRQRSRLLILAAVSGTLLAAGSARMARAQEGDPADLMIEGERRLIFVNEAPDTPCLTVSKEVQNAPGGSRAPEGDRFTFRLFLDGQRAGNVRYRIFNEAGEEMVDLTGAGVDSLVPAGSGSGDPVPLRTGRDGSFSLEGGQYALFEDVSAGELWEVWELESDRYERILPKSTAVCSGTIEKNGSHAEYVNRYDPPGDPSGDEGTIEITKHILWPENMTLPERGHFQVRVWIDGSAWAGAPVQLQDLEEGAAVEYARTDSDGIFEIRGNQRAVLTGLPLGSDAVVEEIDDTEDAFVVSGEAAWRGAVTSRARVTFTNRLADFVVAKSLRSGDPEQQFLFCLRGKNHLPMSGVSYYLVDENGDPEGEDLLQTDGDGHFTLKKGERAVFTGLAEGTGYSVREEQMLGYRQVIPEDADGYTGLSVKNGIPVLSFENEKTDTKLFTPSAGGTGIGFLLLAAIAGMMACSAILIKRAR